MLDKNITYWKIPHIGKRGISIRFQISFNKNFACRMHSVNNYDLFEKDRSKLSPLKSNNVRQNYHMPGIFLLNKNAKKTVAPTRCGLYLFPLNLYGKPWIWGKILPNTQKCTHFDHQKNDPSLIDLSLTLLKVLFLPHQIAIFN